MVKIKNWLLALSAFALGVLAIYVKFLRKAATKAKLKSLQEKEKELVNEALKHRTRANDSLKRAREFSKQLRKDSKDV